MLISQLFLNQQLVANAIWWNYTINVKKSKGVFVMTKISNFIVEKKYLILIFFLGLTMVSGYLMTKVNQNEDISQYLADSSSMKQGMDIMDEEFSNEDSSISGTSYLRIMFKGLSEDKKMDIMSELEKIEGVSNVEYDSESDMYNEGEYTLYVVNVSGESYSDKSEKVLNEVKSGFEESSDYTVYLDGDIVQANEEVLPLWIIGIAVLILVIILFIMCASWFEPVLFMMTIAMAIVINMGTNAFLSSVSNMTYSIAAILQLVLSMDYSIILMNRYRQEKKLTNDVNKAMKNAITKAFSAIISSSLTTIVGLLSLVFMSFKIGLDMGVVLAKGVSISLICIFVVLPGLIIIFNKLIDKTRKKVLEFKMPHLSHFEFRARYLVFGVFIVILVGSVILKQKAEISYTQNIPDKVSEVFPEKNTVVLLYDNKDEENILDVIGFLSSSDKVQDISSYKTTVGAMLNSEQISKMFTMDKSFVDFILYERNMDSVELAKEKLTLINIISFLSSEDFMNSIFAESMTNTGLEQISGLSEEILNSELSFSEFSNLTGIDVESSAFLYEIYNAYNSEEDILITPVEFLDYLVNDVAVSDSFGQMFDEETISQLKASLATMESGIKSLVGEEHSLMAITTTFQVESEETTDFMEELTEISDNTLNEKYYLIGNSPMVFEMENSFSDELNRITLITIIAIFIVVALTFRSISIPFVLILVIQVSIYSMMSVIGLQGYSINFIALLIVQSILMGATIDYGILFTSYYRENRETMNIKDSVEAAYRGSMHTILTSGLIMIFVTGILSKAFSDPQVGQICESLSRGALIATLLIIFILPALLAIFDKFVEMKIGKHKSK